MGATAKVITLTGDIKNQESAEHIITFKGGAISVCRTSDNEYWAHVHVNKEQVNDIEQQSKVGSIKMIRMDTPDGVEVIVAPETDHFAVLITTSNEQI